MYTLGEDDEEMRRMRERFMQSQPAGIEPMAGPPRDLDPALLHGFLSQRAPEQQERPYPIPQRDDEPDYLSAGLHGLAGIADAFLNKGRGLGQIAQSHAAGQIARRQQSDEAFEADRKAYLAQDEADARNQQIALMGRNADMRQQEIDASLAKERAIQARFLAGEGSPEAQAADLRYKQALAAKAEADAARDPNAITPYQQAQLDAQKAERGERDKDRDADREWKKENAKLQAAATAAQREATAETKRQAAETKADSRKQDLIRQYNKDTEKYVPLASSMRDADAVISKLRGANASADIPGIGATGLVPIDLLSDEGKIIRNAKTNMADDLLRIKSGAAAPPAEVAKIEASLAPGATDETFMVGYEAWRNIIQGHLKRFGVGREDLARESLRAAELEEWLYGAAPPPPEQPQSVFEGARTTGPVTGPAPKPTAATIEFDGDMYTEEEMELLRQAGVAP